MPRSGVSKRPTRCRLPMPPATWTSSIRNRRRSPARRFIRPETVVDISDKMKADGRLDWDAPAGRWLVLRFGYTILSKECPDFFSREALDHHLRQSVEKLIPIAGKHVGKTWTHVHEDSYENGPQTWTPAFREEFRKRRGYDMTPWLPVLAGRLVGSRALSDRFLHDYRSTISDLYVENHFGHFAKRLQRSGPELLERRRLRLGFGHRRRAADRSVRRHADGRVLARTAASRHRKAARTSVSDSRPRSERSGGPSRDSLRLRLELDSARGVGRAYLRKAVLPGRIVHLLYRRGLRSVQFAVLAEGHRRSGLLRRLGPRGVPRLRPADRAPTTSRTRCGSASASISTAISPGGTRPRRSPIICRDANSCCGKGNSSPTSPIGPATRCPTNVPTGSRCGPPCRAAATPIW